MVKERGPVDCFDVYDMKSLCLVNYFDHSRLLCAPWYLLPLSLLPGATESQCACEASVTVSAIEGGLRG